jgi:GAF domain-containing protein
MQSQASLPGLADKFIAQLAPLLKIGYGALYEYDEDSSRLHLLGSYAYPENRERLKTFALGEGLLGQCAANRSPIILADPPADYVRISSALGDAAPRTLAVLPVVHGDDFTGALELASFSDIDADQMSLLKEAMPILAMNPAVARSGRLRRGTQPPPSHIG